MTGNTGALSAREVIELLVVGRQRGSLILSSREGSLLITLDGMGFAVAGKLGRAPTLACCGLDFRWHAHLPAALPQLPSRFAESPLPLLRAVPRAAGATLLPVKLGDLRLLISHLASVAFSGAVTFERGIARALVLVVDGKLAVAVYEEDGQVKARSEALRALRARYLAEAQAALWLEPLPELIVRALVGLSLQQPLTAGDADGLRCDGEGFSYLKRGAPLLQVAAPCRGAMAQYAAAASFPELHFPDEPPGWEQQRFALTLRGKDALNPITDVAMQFKREFGSAGRRILEKLEFGLTAQAVAEYLGLELDKLRSWLERFEQEGLVRALPDERLR